MTSTSLHQQIAAYIQDHIIQSFDPYIDLSDYEKRTADYHSQTIITMIVKHFCDSEHIHTSEEILREMKDNS